MQQSSPSIIADRCSRRPSVLLLSRCSVGAPTIFKSRASQGHQHEGCRLGCSRHCEFSMNGAMMRLGLRVQSGSSSFKV
eukprot:3212794-Rhodomonas_salina.1